MAALFAVIIAVLFWGQYRSVQAMLALLAHAPLPPWDYFTPQPWDDVRGI